MPIRLTAPEPLKIDTATRGQVTLNWLTLRGVEQLEQCRTALDDTGFLHAALALHFVDPAVSAAELSAWDPQDLQRVAAAWTQYAHGLNRELEKGDLATAFGRAFAEYVSETRLRFRDTITPLFESIRRQTIQLQDSIGTTQAIGEALRAFQQSQTSWARAVSNNLTQLHDSRFRAQMTFDPVLLNTQLLANVTAAFSQNAALRPFALDLPLITETLRSSSWHQIQLTSIIGLEQAAASASTRLLEGLRSLTLSSQLVWSEWGSEGRLPPEQSAILREAPTIELYAASSAATALMSAEEIDEPSAVIERIATRAVQIAPALKRVDPGLIMMYTGAIAVIGRPGPDHPRHFAVSLRELLTHLLHKLAPDDDLRTWDGARPEDFPNGRPTRQLRLRYIFRDVQNSAYAKFIDDDICRTLELMDVLNGGTHRLVNAADGRSLRLMLRRVEGVLAIILEAARVM